MRDRTTPGRPREFDDTEMLRKIMRLFWKNGFEGVSLSMIMKETELQKASLYAAFGDKRSMYLKALGQYHDDIVSAAALALKDDTVPAKQRIEAFINAPLTAAQKNDRSGCFLCNASADQSDLDPTTKTQVSVGFDLLTSALTAALRDAHPDLSSEDIAARAKALLAVYVGFRILARSDVAIDGLERAASNVSTWVHT